MNSNSINIDFEVPKIMGILNITPDSFFDGGKYLDKNNWSLQVSKMIEEGVDIIDIGAISTRPGSEFISEQQEIDRLCPVLETLAKEFPQMLFSVDTFRSKVARHALDYGVEIINDVYGGTFDPEIYNLVKDKGVYYVMMHIKGDPKNMQINPIDKNITSKVISFFDTQLALFNPSAGYDKLILDPGFGFGKSLEANYELLKEMPRLHKFNLPLLVGVSRKSMINKVLNVTPNEALNGTTVLNTMALMNGAKILRVHDVKEAVQVRELYRAYQGKC
ncbi:MAG: dihydropteroate synthase [Bacteroidales bacterium]